MRALEAVLEAFHGIAAVEEKIRGDAAGHAAHEKEAARQRAESHWREQYHRLQLQSGQQIETLRGQLLARTTALATLRNAYYREVIRIKRTFIEAGAQSTTDMPPLFEPALQLGSKQQQQGASAGSHRAAAGKPTSPKPSPKSSPKAPAASSHRTAGTGGSSTAAAAGGKKAKTDRNRSRA